MEWFLPINDRHQAGVDSCMGLGKICTPNVENMSPVVDSLIDTISKYSWVG